MDAWLLGLLPVAALVPVLFVVRVLLVARRVRAARFGPDAAGVVSAEEFPGFLHEIVRPWREILESEGFSGCRVLRVPSVLGPKLDTHVLELVDETQTIRAELGLFESLVDVGFPLLRLTTTLRDGREIVSLSDRQVPLVPSLARVEAMEREGSGPRELLDWHRMRVARAGEPAPLEEAATDARNSALARERYDLLRVSGRFERQTDGFLVYRPWPAMRVARSVLRDVAAQTKQALARRRLQPPDGQASSTDALIAVDSLHYAQFVAFSAGRFPAATDAAISLGSLFLFWLSFSWLPSFAPVVALTAGILVHEAGHWLAMRAFGLRDAHMIFLPLLGGIALSQAQRALPPWKHLVILLAGPLPGILAAMVIMGWVAETRSGPWFEGATLVIALNVFNLLPLLPLDGGQIATYVVGSRVPFARPLLLGVSALAFLVLGYASSMVLFWVFSAGMLLRLPLAWQTELLFRRVRTNLPASTDETTIVSAIFAALHANPIRRLSPSTRLTLVRQLSLRLQTPAAGFGTLGLAVAGYLSLVVLGVPLFWLGENLEARHRLAEIRAHLVAAGLPLSPPSDLVREPVLGPLAEAFQLVDAAVEEDRVVARENDRPRIPRDVIDDPLLLECLHRAGRQPILEPRELLSNGPIHQALRTLSGLSRRANREARADEAFALVTDALLLLSRLRERPDAWNWHEHARWMQRFIDLGNEILLRGAACSRTDLATWIECLDEPAELAFARVSLARFRIDWYTEFFHRVSPEATDFDAGMSRPQRLGRAVRGVEHAWYADQLADVLALLEGIDAIAAGKLPAFDLSFDASNEGSHVTNFLELAEHVAWLRIASSGLAVDWEIRFGQGTADSFDALTAPWWRGTPLHPVSHVPMKWSGVLRFADPEGVTTNLANVRHNGQPRWRREWFEPETSTTVDESP